MRRLFQWLALFITSAGLSGFLPSLLGKPGAGAGLIGSSIGVLILSYYLAKGLSASSLFWLTLGLYLVASSMLPTAEKFIAQNWGPRKDHTGKLTTHDYNETNIDEVVGQMIAGFPLILYQELPLSTKVALLAFSLALFRYLDVKKPLLIGWLETSLSQIKYPYFDLGVMLDDVLAGVYVAITVSAYIWCAC